MKAHDIFRRLSDADAGEILTHLHQEDKPAYRAALEALAGRRRLRPVFLERKPRPERHAWMRTELARPTNHDLATEILQAWLLGAHRPLICQFLDALKVPHDGEGLLESLPPEPPVEDLRAAIDGLFQDHPALPVTVYLFLFPEMDIADWPELSSLLETDPRFANPTSAAATS